jgi:P-type conjugative transfer protein TrbJ
MNKSSKSIVCIMTAAAVAMAPATSALAGGRVGGGATEWTQLANNVELIASVSKQAQMVAEQIISKITQINQLQTMMTNLKQLPGQVISQSMAPYAEQLNAFRELQGAVNGIRSAADNTRAMYENRGLDFNASGKDVRSYIEFEVALAQRRGGVYKQRLDQDLAAMDQLRDRAANLRTVAQRTASITGNVEGLQQLGQLSAMSAGELMEIKAAILAQNADRNEQAKQEQDATAVRSSVADNSIKAARDRAVRNPDRRVNSLDPFRQWGNLEQPR